MRRSTVLVLPPQLVFPAVRYYQPSLTLKGSFHLKEALKFTALGHVLALLVNNRLWRELCTVTQTLAYHSKYGVWNWPLFSDSIRISFREPVFDEVLTRFSNFFGALFSKTFTTVINAAL
jgi:hypothetical protein